MAISDPLGRDKVEPLLREVWFRQVALLHGDIARVDDAILTARLIRRAYFLSCLAPDPFWFSFAPKLEEDEFEAVIETRDLATATRAIMPPFLEIAYVRPDGTAKVTLSAPQLGLTGEGEDADDARAILAAWTNCILAADQATQSAKVADVFSLAQHRSRPGQRPQSSDS